MTIRTSAYNISKYFSYIHRSKYSYEYVPTVLVVNYFEFRSRPIIHYDDVTFSLVLNYISDLVSQNPISYGDLSKKVKIEIDLVRGYNVDCHGVVKNTFTGEVLGVRI